MFAHWVLGNDDMYSGFWFDIRIKQLIAEDGRTAIAVQAQAPVIDKEQGGRWWKTYEARVATP